MSPLAPTANGFQQNFKENGKNIQSDRILISNDQKVVYSMRDLFGMRHSRSQAPNIKNRYLLASITRPNVYPIANFTNSFSFNIMSSVLSQIPTDRSSYNRPTSRYDQNYHNGGHMNNGGIDGDRQRQMNRDRGHGNGTKNHIQIRLSIKTDVKLREAENAWKPTFMAKTDNDNTAELYKQVRSILNKLTAQNFPILSEQFQSLIIDTEEKLVEVINLVFNKAVNEPTFSEEYAKLCHYLSKCSQKIDSLSTECAYFKRTLINKCQVEFEQHVANKNTIEAALAPLITKLETCKKQGDLNGVNEIKLQIAEEESNLRRRLVSTVRFIGELYKLDMLTTNIMKVCISSLIREASTNQANTTQANEKLECLCKLLTTVGAKLERKPANNDKVKANYLDLTANMNQLKRIADNKIQNFKATTRIKFMIMDVIELRNNQWTPKITNAHK